MDEKRETAVSLLARLQVAHMPPIIVAIFLLLTATGAEAQDHPASAGARPPSTTFDVPLNGEQAGGLLGSVLSGAVANIRDYVEFETSTKSGDREAPAAREFRLNLYPKGKSRSAEHYTAEGSFGMDPDHPRSELRFRFEPGLEPESTLPPADGDPV